MRRALDAEQEEMTMRLSDEEAFAVLGWMIAQGRISVGATEHLATAA